MGLFSTLHSRFILNIVPHCPSMSHARKYFHKAIQLKHIYKCQQNATHLLLLLTWKAENENHLRINRDERIKEWTFMRIYLRFYRQLISKLFQLFRWGSMVNLSSQYSNRNLNIWHNMPSVTQLLELEEYWETYHRFPLLWSDQDATQLQPESCQLNLLISLLPPLGHMQKS
jgi:hypothetical protein